MFGAVDVVAVETTVVALTILTAGRAAVLVLCKGAAFISGTLTIEPGRALTAACNAAELLAAEGSVDRPDVATVDPSS